VVATLAVAFPGTVASAGGSGSQVTIKPASTKATAAARAMKAAARRLGLPPNGPAFFYTPEPKLPQLQNRDPRFRLPFNPVSGTERYRHGEYTYTDFIYDDTATTYPDNFKRYANNAADLVEFRISTRGSGAMAVRFLLNTLKVPDSTMLAVAFDSDRNAKTGSSTLPRDPGMPFPGTDQVLTTWGTGAIWSHWAGDRWRNTRLEVHADTEANQITVTVPNSVAHPTGKWRATLATGLYDRRTGGWLAAKADAAVGGVALPVSSAAPATIINLGFRFNEVSRGLPRPGISDAGSSSAKQNDALAAGEPTRFAHLIDFDLLRRGGSRSTVPSHGMMYRIFASRLKSVMVSADGTPAKGNPHRLGEGVDVTSLHGRYLSPLQPYALYVPSHYRAGRPAPLTFALHGDGGEYFWLADDSNYSARLFGENRNSIVLSPAARGTSGFYVGDHEHDIFEAWNDVARHYTLDPKRTTITGYSMGGHGTYRIGLLYPHLFARAAPMAPAICRGMWLIVKCTTTEDTVANHWVENARNLPIFHVADMLSELTFYPGQAQQAIGPATNGLQSLDALGYRYRFWSVAMDHLLMGTDHPQVGQFLGHHKIAPQPFHVTYARMPSSDLVRDGLIHNRAYWLSGIELRDASDQLAKGVIDAVSLGFGKSDPASHQTITPGVTAAGWPYVEIRRTWDGPGKVPVQNRIRIHATNIKTVTIDPVAAHVNCNVKFDVESDGPIEIRLLGCG
jgi:hypothetical protein